MIDNDELYSFMKVCEGFVKSTVQLRDAAALCNEDPIKQDMVAFIHDEFEEARARSEGVKLMVDKDFSKSRDFILQEVKGITESEKQQQVEK